MKFQYGLCLLLLLVAGCGTPDPMLHTNDSKGRPGWTKEESEQKPAEGDSEESTTTWKRTGTHEVEQR